MSKPTTRRQSLQFECLESRSLATMVFLLSGAAFAAASPGPPTETAAADLTGRGDDAIQVPYPNMNNMKVFDSLAVEIRQMSRGQPIGLVGFSAGGTLALRLSQIPSLHVKDVLSFYGPPDLRDWLSQHHGQSVYHHVMHDVGGNSHVIAALSGPIDTTAHVVGAFGTADTTVYAAPSAANLKADLPGATIDYYDGPHGVTISSCYSAFLDFVAHL